LKFRFLDGIIGMPRKIRQLIADLEKHGFVDRGGKGSHRNFLHPSGVKITLLGARREKMPNIIRSEISNVQLNASNHEQDI
jgi:predicted RNA binding protein YcfA (HicA-like mRNA interferase family)